MSKEKKIAKKEAKAAKKAAKLEKKQAAQYEKLVKSIEKKNAKAEKKANKKGKPFVPAPIPTQEEAFANAGSESTGKKVVKLIILILLIWLVIYFLVMWFTYVAPIKQAEEDPTSAAQEYDRYVNEHEITTTPTYTKAECAQVLKQVLHDNWRTLGYNSDPSSSSINATSGIISINGVDCYQFTASGKKYAVATNISGVYLIQNGEYQPLTFHGTGLLDFED